tara:strand:- start:100 stop:759 length:660 start_codon:yes stop_codon:yes gene_type:complete
LVVAVRNLDAASKLYESLGFTLTPLARHPFGTSNRLVQFKTSFIELVAVSQAELINETTDVDFSFGAYNRDFLTKREGMSMVAMKSTDSKLDRYEFQSAGLELVAPFSFKRMAKQPNGVEVEVGFDLTYLPRLGAPDAMIFFAATAMRRNISTNPITRSTLTERKLFNLSRLNLAMLQGQGPFYQQLMRSKNYLTLSRRVALILRGSLASLLWLATAVC